ncbi:MAG: Rne/Rng family ribonuclease [Candidatus Omnitrophica bacterium]|nr:Rne/Rng family ribonuclease [Candidatus Omnitrophota bacterium]
MRKLSKKIIVNAGISEYRVAILENGKLEEFYVEQGGNEQIFGNIYKGVVESIIPGIGAAFVNIGTDKNGFLYVTDVLENTSLMIDDADDFQEEKVRHGNEPRITDLLKVGQEILVQVVKESIGTKGPRLSTHVSLPGRHIVLTPFDSNLGISKRITAPEERSRIRDIIKHLNLPTGLGCIVRTAAQGLSTVSFVRELKYLLNLWQRIKYRSERVKAPELLGEEYGVVLRIVRDQFTDDVETVVIDSRDEYKRVVRFLNLFMPTLQSRVSFYNGKQPIFDHYGIEKEIEKIFRRKIYLKNGGSIVIEQTEGMVAIDVNTERYVGKTNIEDTVYRTNIEAAREIARQVRLRDIGGIIVIDFIDMRERDHRAKVQDTLDECLAKDKAKFKVLKISQIGVVEMTRQRVRKSLERSMYKDCPYCKGRGLIKSETTIAMEVLRKVEIVANATRSHRVDVGIHPAIYDYLMAKEKELLVPLRRRCRKEIRLYKDEGIHIEESKIA